MTDNKRRDEAWEKFKEEDEPLGQAKLYYKDNGEYFMKGYDQGMADAREYAEKLAKALEWYVINWRDGTDAVKKEGYFIAQRALEEYRKDLGE